MRDELEARKAEFETEIEAIRVAFETEREDREVEM